MPTTINTPPREGSNDGLGTGMIVGILMVAVILGAVFLMYGLPMLQGGEPSGSTNIEVEVPATAPATTPEPAE